ncbi:MAG: hypothetical protein F6K47_23155 [Symploca sp. SIO2E6]|nr:hypothetical protein [Symploca sp. SIO2E6]
MPKILQPEANYTFRSFFELPNDPDEILAEFEYSYTQARLSLPKTTKPLSGLESLQAQIEATLPYVQLTSEVAKREVLVAPVLLRVATLCHRVLRFEYPLKVNNWLQGNLDYLIRAEQQVVVVEAKRDDLTRGFTQLAVEMIALSLLENAPRYIYGAVTIGSFWVFGCLDKETKLVTQDIGGYKVPDDVEDLVRVLVSILD